jgi:hypothetical protein
LPNEADIYLYSGLDHYFVRVYGESNRTADWRRLINGQVVQYRHSIGDRAHTWHTYAWTRDSDGWWSLSIDGINEALNFRQDLSITSFDYVELSLHRNQSEIEWVHISGSIIPTLEPPKVVTEAATDVGETSATLNARIKDDDGEA